MKILLKFYEILVTSIMIDIEYFVAPNPYPGESLLFFLEKKKKKLNKTCLVTEKIGEYKR